MMAKELVEVKVAVVEEEVKVVVVEEEAVEVKVYYFFLLAICAAIRQSEKSSVFFPMGCLRRELPIGKLSLILKNPIGGGGDLIKGETLETKKVNREVYWVYAKAVGLLVTFMSIFLCVINQVFTVGTNFWLAEWSDDPDSAIPHVRNVYLGVYGGLGAGAALTTMIVSLLVTLGGLVASTKLHR